LSLNERLSHSAATHITGVGFFPSAEQMSNAKRVDRTFYTRNFDGRVLETVAGYTGARLLCDTLELETVAQNIFKIPSVK
jgi:hypothetical protein